LEALYAAAVALTCRATWEDGGASCSSLTGTSRSLIRCEYKRGRGATSQPPDGRRSVLVERERERGERGREKRERVLCLVHVCLVCGGMGGWGVWLEGIKGLVVI